MKTKKILLTKIKPYGKNPRKNAAAVAAVKKSITEFGFIQPLVLDKDNTIIIGHTRYLALKELGHKDADCLVVDLPPAKVRKLRIADNAAGDVAEWDMDKLRLELREIGDSPEMQEFFASSMDIAAEVAKSFGSAAAPVSAAQVATAGNAQSVQFTTGGGAKQDLIPMICPHCAKRYDIDRKDLPPAS